MGFALFGMYYLLDKRPIASFLFLLLSIGVKFASVLLLPLFLLWVIVKRGVTKESGQQLVQLSSLLMILAVGIATFRTNFQPWYLLFFLPIGVLLTPRLIALPIGILSFTTLLMYVPYLYLGNWDSPVPSILNILTITGIVSALITYGYLRMKAKNN